MSRPGHWLLIIAVLASSPASAKDLRRLSELVVPAYTAMSIAMLCARDDSGFVTAHTGPRGTALHYA